MVLFNDADAAKLDAESSSKAGWSVRDNPIASEGSYRSNTSDQEFDEWHKADDFPRLRKLGSIDVSPRDIHMISPDAKVSQSVDDGATLNPTGRDCNPGVVHNPDRVCHAYVSAKQNIKSCTLLVHSQPKDMDAEKQVISNGPFNLILKGKPKSGKICEDSAGEFDYNDPFFNKSLKQVDQHERGHPTIRMIR